MVITVAFAQKKHVTFTDSLKTESTSAYYNNFYLAKSPLFNGYFLGSGYDDMSYEMKYYIGKTDFKGDLLWDSIFYFQEPFPSGWASTYLKVAEANDGVVGFVAAEGVNSNNISQPFLFHVNNFGQIDWNQYYSVDTAETTVYQVVQTNDGGYIMVGGVFDFSGGQASVNSPTMKSLSYKYGMLYKVNNSGTVEWSKWYANKDTIEFNFNTVAQTYNGEYIVAGNSFNSKGGFKTGGTLTQYDNFMNVMMVDQNGEIIWNNALNFDTLVDNTYYFEETQVNIMDNQTAFVAFKYYDTLNYYYNLGIASYNIADGAVNWVKGYSLANDAVDFNFRKSVVNKAGHLVVFYDDYGDGSQSYILEFDANGTIINSTSLQENLVSNTYYQDMIATEDGGIMLSGYPFEGNGVMLWKTDHILTTYCPEEEAPNLPMTIDLDFTGYTIVDTLFDVSLNTGTLTVTPDSIVDFHNDRYCECNISIAGNIVDPDLGSATDSVVVTLYRYDAAPGNYVVHGVTTTDVAGYYQFNYLPEGQYVIRAVPSPIKYPDLVRTYYNSTASVTQWDSAEVVYVNCGNPMMYDITLFKAVPQTGMWQCSGYVFEYDGFTPFAKKAPGDPIPDIDITVEQSPGGAISSTTTDNDGFFHFTGLNNNATFIVRADVPGLPNDSIYTFTVNPGDGALDSLNFYVDSVGVYIIPDGLVGVKEQFNSLKGFDIIPNPTTGQFNLMMNVKENSQIAVKIVNLVGEEVLSQSINVNVGENKSTFDLSDFSSGIYFVKITQGEKYLIKKLIKQ